MKTKILTRINLMLSALIVLLTGCKAQKSVTTQAQSGMEPTATVSRDERVVCKYGIPPAVLEMQRQEQLRRDSIENAEKEKQTVEQPAEGEKSEPETEASAAQ